jgi:hypothetical protein
MANAVKSIAKYIRNNPDSEASPILRELCQALESGAAFELGRMYDLNNKTFSLAINLIEEWRFDRHMIERRLQKYLEQPEE